MEETLRKRWHEVDPQFQPLTELLLQRSETGIDAILLYGSCLSPTLRTKTSFPDFYFIVDEYSNFHSKRIQACLNRWLPPNIYGLQIPSPFFRAKYCVIRWKDLLRETCEKAQDTYHIGRFSKRMAILHIRSSALENSLIQAAAGAVQSVVHWTLPRMPETFTLEELILSALRFSYEGEIRLEKQDKASHLVEAQRDYYLKIYREALHRELLSRGSSLPKDNLYRNPYQGEERKKAIIQIQRFLRRSRRRHMARWPKYIFSQENYVDILVEKIERTHHISIHLNERERRHPFIFGWKYLFMLLRKGLIR